MVRIQPQKSLLGSRVVGPILTDSHQPMPGVQWLSSQSLVWCERTFSRGPVEVGRSQEHHPRKGLSPLGSLLSSPLLPIPQSIPQEVVQ